MLMVKPGMPYLDVLKEIKSKVFPSILFSSIYIAMIFYSSEAV